MNVALADASWKVSLLTMDNLIANFCIVAKEQRGFEQDRDALLLDVACQHHCGALCGKPVITKLGSGSLASAYVRLAHVLESSRSFASFLEALDAEVEASLAPHRFVPELPEKVLLPRRFPGSGWSLAWLPWTCRRTTSTPSSSLTMAPGAKMPSSTIAFQDACVEARPDWRCSERRKRFG